jgi:LysM repeat protein
MSTPNPLIPQGTFQAQAAKGASNVRIAVATIVAIHVVFFGGLLLQGCKRDTQTGQSSGASTNAEPSTNLALPQIDSNSLYYANSSNLPTDTGATLGTPANSGNNALANQPSTQGATPETMWQATNLASPLGTASQNGAQPSGATKEYTVVRGDYFGKIARAHGTTVSALKAANPNVDPTKIKAGDKLNVPEPAAAASAPSDRAAASPTATGASGNSYIVKAGDSLTKIARSHGITVSQLRAANNLKTSRVNVGQKLKIPAPNPAQVSTGRTSNLPRSSGL